MSILMLTNSNAKAQYVLKEADAQFDLFNYDKAAILYTEAYQKKKTLKSAERLAESYRLMRDYKQAESWYAILTADAGAKPEAFRWYAEMLKNNSKYSEAKIQYAKYKSLALQLTNEQIFQIDVWQKSCDSAVKWMRNPKNISIVNEKALNSPQSDWAAVNYDNSIVFTSDRANVGAENVIKDNPFLKFDSGKRPDKKSYGWTGNGYLRIYQKNKEGISLFPLNAGTDYHIGASSFSSDGNEVYFTLTRIPKKIERIKNAASTINIEIYSCKKKDNAWSEPVPFRYNNVQKWSVGDPFLSSDGSTLYFVSDKPDGKGGTDIYFCKRKASGDWDDAINLSAVNTTGNERSPMTDGQDFYFSTDGNISMGGLDIYKAKMTDRGISNIENMGYPVNSPQDDFAFNSNLTGKLNGYFASNRYGGLGSDDIYSFIEQRMLIFMLEGTVFNKETNLPLANAVVSLNKLNGSPLKVQTDESGSFKFNLDEDSDFDLLADKTNFRSAADNLTTKGLTDSKIIKRDLYLNPIVINKAIKLENIYYDFDKSNIRPDAAKELDKLVAILKENPTIWIELGSHTDSRGNDQYNQWLSQSRANSAVQYIIDRGIAKNRITAKGYGESIPVNGCVNGVKCSEADYQLNRRTEFKIVKQ